MGFEAEISVEAGGVFSGCFAVAALIAGGAGRLACGLLLLYGFCFSDEARMTLKTLRGTHLSFVGQHNSIVQFWPAI